MPGPFTSTHTISWNANTETDLAGYKVYAGRASGVYPDPGINVGNVTSYQLTIDDSGAWFFQVTAYDTSDNESVPSAEVSGNWLMLGNF